MKRILIMSFSPLHRDPRVKRQVETLMDSYSITCAGYTDIEETGVIFWPIKSSSTNRYKRLKEKIFLVTRQYLKYYWQRTHIVSLYNTWQKEGYQKFDLIIANDIETLMVALEIAKGCPVFLDAHEYSPRQSNSFFWRLFRAPYVDWQCRTYINKATLMSTVNNSLSYEFEREYGKKSIVIYNAPVYHELEPGLTEGKVIRLVHHGGAARQRGLEEIISILNYLDDRYTLDFYLIAPNQNCKQYLAELKELARQFGDRVTFREPVTTDQLPDELNQYDIGVALIQPSNFNNAHSLSNKFFEFIQARLVLATGPTPDMKELIEKFDLGIVSDDFSAKSLAGKISSLSVDDINRIKQKVHNSAGVLSFQESGKLLLKSVQELVDDGDCDV